MIDRQALATTAARLGATTRELPLESAHEASGRMLWLWAWSMRCGRVLTETDLDEAIEEFWLENPNGVFSV
jgi:hypothetical protein